MNNRIGLTLLILTTILTGCSKYDEGPLLSLYSKGMRVAGTWYFERVSYGEVDSTANYRMQYLNYILVRKADGGAFTWNHNLYAGPNDPNSMEGGTWKFYSDDDSIEMVVFKDFAAQDSVLLKWKINRLAYTEFWLERNLKDGTSLKWQLIKYAY